MKVNISFRKGIKVAVAIGLLSIFFSCKDEDLITVDRNTMDNTIFNYPGSIEYFLSDTYDLVMPDFPLEYTTNNHNQYYASDETYMTSSDATMRKALGLGSTFTSNDIKYVGGKYQYTKGDNRYFDIFKCNLAIKSIPSSPISQEDKNRFLGQFYALRAISYFEMVRLYGGVPLVLEPVDPANPHYPRAKAKECFEAIVADLDSAISKLKNIKYGAQYPSGENGRITRTAAAAYKARVLLYWASPQFNPRPEDNVLGVTYDANRWQEALKANKEAYDICIADGRALVEHYEDIFRNEGWEKNKEALLIRSYSNKLAKRGNTVETRVRPSSEGGSPSDYYVPTVRLLNAYPMNDGRPISGSTQYDPVLFWKNRDPRFEATIAYLGSSWTLSGITRRQWTYTGNSTESSIKPFYCKRFSTPDLPKGSVPIVNDIGGSGMDWIELRFAEVLLNYAECANEVGDIGLAKDMVRKLRIRAGILPGNFDYGLALATTSADMRNLIANERMVEFAFEGKRLHDLRRTRTLHKLTGPVSTIRFEPVSNARRDTLNKEVNALTGQRRRDTLNTNSASTVKFFFKYPYPEVTGINATIAVPTNYYFYPLPNFMMNSDPLMEQTIDWDNGTFNPLK